MIVVTTPTGQIGSRVVKLLTAANRKVRVIVRDATRLSPTVRDSVDVVEGSHGDGSTVERAFDGADAVFWLVPPDPQARSVEAAYVDFTRPAARVLRSSGVRHVVGVSSLGRGKPQASRAGLITASLAMDDLIADSGVNYRALAMPSFMDNTLRQVASIRQGIFSAPMRGDLAAATCATDDIADVAAKLLIDRTWIGNDDVRVLGPADLSSDEMVAIMSDVLGISVRFTEMPLDALKAGLLARGRSEAMAQATVDMMEAVNDGIYSNEPRPSSVETPTTFREFCERTLKLAANG